MDREVRQQSTNPFLSQGAVFVERETVETREKSNVDPASEPNDCRKLVINELRESESPCRLTGIWTLDEDSDNESVAEGVTNDARDVTIEEQVDIVEQTGRAVCESKKERERSDASSTSLPRLSERLDDFPPPPSEWEKEGGRVRIFVELLIGGKLLEALIDTGATISVFGRVGGVIVKSLGLSYRAYAPSDGHFVTMANGTPERVLGEALFPIELDGVRKWFPAIIVKNLKSRCILGMDFIHAFGINVYGKRGTWEVDGSGIEHPVARSNDEIAAVGVCFGLETVVDEQRDRLNELLDKIIPTMPKDFSKAVTLTQHAIDAPRDKAVKQRMYRRSPVVIAALHAEVDRMLEGGIIERSSSDWASPPVMVPKPNGTYRFCVDYRELNKVTRKDAYPLPRMDSILDKLHEAVYLTTLDMSAAYHQIMLEENSRHFTAFVVEGKGLFQFKRMPYGLCNAPATFQRMMDRLIGPELEPHAFAYLDDIIIVNRTFNEHLEWIEKIMTIIREAGLILNFEKSEFCREEVRYLGFLVNRDGLRPDPEKLRPILEYPRPRNAKELRRFNGMVNWYHRHLKNIASAAGPLNKATSKTIDWNWTEIEEAAFQAVKREIENAAILTFPNYERPFVVYTDASGTGIGAVLTQQTTDAETLIACASRVMTGPETRYTVTEKECLAVVWAVRKFRPYLEGYSFTVVTDHSSLRWLHNLRDPVGRLARWAFELSGYKMEIVHRKGTENEAADALSRMFDDDDVENSEQVNSRVEIAEIDWYEERRRAIERNPRGFPEWRLENRALYFYRPDAIKESTGEDPDAWKLVVPSEDCERVLEQAHDSEQAGHAGVERTYRRLATFYYWPGMYRDVKRYVGRCTTCAMHKPDQMKPMGTMKPKVVHLPWDVVAADTMGPYPRSKTGNKYLIVFEDLFTRWVECVPVAAATGKTIAEAFRARVICRWGTPRVFLTDNGTEFVNQTIKGLTDEFGIERMTTPPYHAQANPVERVNRNLKIMIASYISADHREWDLRIAEFQFAYNTAVHSSLGVSPAFLNLGREPRPAQHLRRMLERDVAPNAPEREKWVARMSKLVEMRDLVTQKIREASEKQAKYYNRHRRDVTFHVGDRVYRRFRTLSKAVDNKTAKFVKRFTGPYEVTKIISPSVVELSSPNGQPAGRYHVKDLRFPKTAAAPTLADAALPSTSRDD